MTKKTTQKKEIKSNEAKDVYEALFRFQNENIQIPKRGVGMINGRTYNYPLLDDSIFVTRPFLQKNGLGITQVGEGTDLVTKLFHPKSKTKIVSKLPLGNPSSSQDLGSRITYLRRYMFNAALGLSNEDVDGAKNPQDLPPLTAPATVPMPVQPAMSSINVPAPETGNIINTTNMPATVPIINPRSEFFLKAEGAIKSAMSVEAIDQLTEQVKKSVRLTEKEKVELLAMLKKEDAAMGTVHI